MSTISTVALRNVLHRSGRLTGRPTRRRLGDIAGDHSGWVFRILRWVRPILVTSRIVVVSRAEDVHAVLADDEHFTVALYEPKMVAITGPFILGLDGTALYHHDHVALRAAMGPSAATDIGDIVLAAARARVTASVGGDLDVVGDVVDPVLNTVVAAYLGAPGPDEATQLRWARSLFEHIFLNIGDKAAVRNRALTDASAMRTHIDGLIAGRKALLANGEASPDDVLARLFRAQSQPGGLHDIAIRHNLIGLIAGWIPTVSKAFTMVVEELLRRPAELERAQAAARSGNVELVAAHVFEALRFRPQTWALVRTCAADCTLAAGTSRATTVRAGAKVLVATRSAMFDARAVSSPGEYRLDRPWSDYLHFGYGLHTCFAAQINRTQLPALALALLEGGDLARAPGKAGRLGWQGAYPASLRVRLGRL
jgi:cytochrome P450